MDVDLLLADLEARRVDMEARIHAAESRAASAESRADSFGPLLEQRAAELAHELHQRFEHELAAQQHPPASSAPRSSFRPTPPPSFQGHQRAGSLDVVTWLLMASDYFDACQLSSDSVRLSAVGTMLEGDAAVWWRFCRSVGPAPTTWAAFSELLRANFERENALKTVRVAFLQLRQTASVQAYVANFRHLLVQIPSADAADSLFRFVHGLKPAIRLQVELHAPNSLADAMAMAERVDTLSYQPRFAGASSSVYGGAQAMELGALDEDGLADTPEVEDDESGLVEQLAALIGRFRPSSSASRSGAPGRPPSAGASLDPEARDRAFRLGLCFHCLKEGHAARACPNRAPASHPKAGVPRS